jgi:hypothetical protein
VTEGHRTGEGDMTGMTDFLKTESCRSRVFQFFGGCGKITMLNYQATLKMVGLNQEVR